MPCATSYRLQIVPCATSYRLHLSQWSNCAHPNKSRPIKQEFVWLVPCDNARQLFQFVFVAYILQVSSPTASAWAHNVTSGIVRDAPASSRVRTIPVVLGTSSCLPHLDATCSKQPHHCALVWDTAECGSSLVLHSEKLQWFENFANLKSQ